MKFWVYILHCADGSYYIGHTDDLERRMGEHEAGVCEGYTASHRPVALLWSQECVTREEALAAEIQIKGWSRKKKEAMMRGDWQMVNKLGRGKHLHQRTHIASTSDAMRPTLSTNDRVISSAINPKHPVLSEPFGFAQDKLSAAKSKDNIRHTQIQETYSLGLDFGTSGARACVLDGTGNVVHESRVAYSDAQAQTPLDWREALHTLLRQLPESITPKLQGIAIAATSATVLLCDEKLEPVSPALLYSDDRARNEAEELARIAPAGHVVCSATSGLAKFLWLTRHGDISHAAYFLHQADWLAALLTGMGGISDYHNALKSGYDVEHLCWPDWVRHLPHAHLLPQVVAPGAAITHVSPAVAEHFGIAADCTVHAGTTDSIAAFIATGVREPGEAVTSLGTTIVLKLLSKQRVEAAHYGVYSHRYGDLWLAGGASNAGGGVLRQHFSDARLVSLSAQIDPDSDSTLDYYPLPRPGERFPHNDPQLAPRLTPRPANEVEFLHGMLQGLSRIEAEGYARLAELGTTPLKSVTTCGGGAHNETWRRMRQRLLGVPLSTASHAEAAYGAALLARDGLVT